MFIINKMTSKFYMGCKKSTLTGKEKQYHEHFKSRGLLPSKVDLRDSGFVPPVLDQGRLNSTGAEKQQEYENK
jgi:hypothetical protein